MPTESPKPFRFPVVRALLCAALIGVAMVLVIPHQMVEGRYSCDIFLFCGCGAVIELDDGDVVLVEWHDTPPGRKVGTYARGPDGLYHFSMRIPWGDPERIEKTDFACSRTFLGFRPDEALRQRLSADFTFGIIESIIFKQGLLKTVVGLIAGAVGVIMFLVTLRRWLRERRKTRTVENLAPE